MRSTKEKLIEFAVGVTGGTLFIAGVLTRDSGSIMSRLWIIIGGLCILAAWLIRKRSQRR
jgi:hypothetical protein